MIDPLKFVEEHGVVLASARGPVPNLAEAVAGQPIRGSWWGHEKGSEIFQALSKLDDSPDILCFRLVLGKITFVHRRLWPALVCLVDELGQECLAAIRQEHTESGAHRNIVTAFPSWVPAATSRAARALAAEDARQMLGAWVAKARPPTKSRRAASTGRTPSRRRSR